MHESLELPPGTADIGTVDRDLLFVPLHTRLADGAVSGGANFFRRIVRVSTFGYRPDDLWNDFAGAFHLHPVSRPKIRFPDEIEVVQRRQLYRRAADPHRLEYREWVERPGAPAVHLDRQQPRLGNVGGGFPRDC